MAHLSDSSSQRLPPRFCAGENGERPSEDPIDRLGVIIEHMNVNDEERVVWNREVGRVVHLVRGRKTQLISGALQAIVSRLQFCLADTLQQDIGMSTDDSIGAMKGGYSLADLYELEGAGVTPLRDRAEGLVELQTIVQTVRGMTLPQINRAAARASAALNSDALRRMESERAIRQCETLLEQRVESMAEFLRLLNTPMLRAHLPTTPHLLARAMRRFGMLSVHFLGYDQARLQNRDRLSGLLAAGCKNDAIERMTMQEVAWVIEALRQLIPETGAPSPELAQLFARVVVRCRELAETTEDAGSAMKALHGISRLHLSHPQIDEVRGRLLRTVADSAPGLSARDVTSTIESWRRSNQSPTPESDQAIAELMKQGAQMVDTYDRRTLVGTLHDIAELTTVRRLPAARAYVQSLIIHGTSLAEQFDPQDVARSMRCMGLTAGDDIDERDFTVAVARRGAQLLADPNKRIGFGNRDVGMSLLALADLERMRAQRFGTLGTQQAHEQFIDGLAVRSAELADRHDAVSGASCFSAFAHIEHRSPAVEHMLQKLAQSGPKWSTVGSPTDCEKRQGESLWGIARMGLSDESALRFARYLARECNQRLPRMNLSAVARNLWSTMVLHHMYPQFGFEDFVHPALQRADALLEFQSEALPTIDAMQLYHAQVALRGRSHPKCRDICRGDVEEWVATGVLPHTLRRLSDVQPGSRDSAAEHHVRKHLQHRFRQDAQPDVLHHGFGLDVAVRFAPAGREPFLVDVEVDGPSHTKSRQLHIDALRDKLLREHFSTHVLRLPYTQDFDELTQILDQKLQKLAF